MNYERMKDYASATYKFLNRSKHCLLEKKHYLNLLEMTDEFKSVLNLSETIIDNLGLPKNFYKNWFKNNYKIRTPSDEFKELLKEIEMLYDNLIEENFKFKKEVATQAEYVRIFQLSIATKKDIDFITKFGVNFITCNDELTNIPLGLYHILVASRLESIDAIFHLGYFLFHGIGLEENYELAIQLWKYACKNGQGDAMYNVGVVYFNGLDPNYQKDIKKAIIYFANGLIFDHANSINVLKRIAKDDENCKMDIISVSYSFLIDEQNKLEKEIDKKQLYDVWYYNILYIGVTSRLLNLWYYLQEEEPNIIKNLDRDTYILDRIKIVTVNIRNKNGITSEDKEDIENIFRELIIFKNCKDKIKLHLLGYFYIQPYGKYENLNLGFYYINKSAKLGYVKAITDLASLYYNGIGIEKDLNKSIDLYFEAKELGCLDAQYLLACIYLYEFKSKKKNEAGFKLIFDGKKKGHQKSIKKYSQLMQ